MFERLQKIIAEQMDVEPETVRENAVLRKDLQADELDLENLVMTLEEEFDLVISDDDFDRWVTVKDIVDTLRENGISE